MPTSPMESPNLIETRLTEELAEYQAEIAEFTREELRALVVLDQCVRGTMDPLKLNLLFEHMFEELGFRSDIHVHVEEAGITEEGVAEAPPEGCLRFHFDPTPEITRDDFEGWIDLYPLDAGRSRDSRDIRFIEFFCRRIGVVLAHQWMYQALSRTHERLRSAVNTVQEISAFVGHEIRSPIASLLSLAFLMKDQIREMSLETPAPGESWKSLVDKMAQAVALLEKITRSTYLLGTLDIDPKAVTRSREWTELGKSLLVTAASAYSFDLRRRGLLLVIRRESRFAHDYVLVHHSWFDAIFDNLLGNAIKYSVEGGRIDFSILKDDGAYVIHVSNPVENPPSPERLNRLFEKGYRGAEADFNMQAIGANQGLGLYFVNRITTLGYGGRVRVWLDNDRNRDGSAEKDLVETQVFGDPESSKTTTGAPYFHIEIRIPESALQ